MNIADVSGYIFIAIGAGCALAYYAPKIKEKSEEFSSKHIMRQVEADLYLKQFKPTEIAVIKNYLDHGGFSPGVIAVIGDINFILLSGDIGKTLRNCPDLLDKAMQRLPDQPGPIKSPWL